MSFLNPTLLAYTAAVAVPILIHLLNRRRFRRVSWAAMRFLRLSVEKNRRRMQVEDLILLLLRCLLVALFAFALARPALRAVAGFLESGRSAAVLILDSSASLGASDGTRSRFDLAREAAERAVDAYPSGSALAVLTAGDRVEELVAEPTYDLNLVRKTVREAAVRDLGTDHAVGVLRALEILRDQNALRKEVVLITDHQSWGWRRLPDVAAALADVTRDTRLRVVLVGEPLENNLAVAALSRSAGFASTRDPIRFHAEIVNRGTTAIRQVRATLHVDGGPAVDEGVVEELKAGEARRLTFFSRLPGAGFHSVSVRIPEDRFPADDERALVVRAVDTVKVLVVDGDPESNSAFFLRNALQPVPPDRAAEFFLQPRVIPPTQLTLTRLGEYDAVILADVPVLPTSAVDALARYVREGGALLCFPGPKAQPEFYNSEFLRRTGLLPASLGAMKGNPEAEDGGFALATGPYDHPLLSLWNEAGAGALSSARFRAAWELMPLNSGTNTAGGLLPFQVVLRFADGTPALVERTAGAGRVLLFASTAGTGWNDLAVRPAFLPLLHRAVASLAEAQESRFNLRTGAGVALRLPGELIGRDVTVTIPSSPERRLTRTLRAGAEGAALDFDGTFEAGVYRAQLAGETSLLAEFAAGLDPAESDLTELSPADRLGLERTAQVVEWAPGQDLRSAFDRERVGVELWLPMAIGMVLLGITETWLAQQFSRSK